MRRHVLPEFDRTARTFPPCAWQGCELRPAEHSAFCSTHRYDGTDARGSHVPHSITDAQRAEMVRRVRSFESPLSIARDLGVTKKTVLRAVRRSS